MQRKRGVILTLAGLKKLQQAKQESEENENAGKRFTFEALSGRTQLCIDTLAKIFACEVKVDRTSLRYCFEAFGLTLDKEDYYFPDLPDSLDPVPVAPPVLPAPPVPPGVDREGYVERPPAESICLSTLRQPGSLIRLKAPKLTGKTTLMSQVMSQLNAQEYRTTLLSFNLADQLLHFTSTSKCLQWICSNISHQLGLPNHLEDYWDEAGIGSKVSCTTYMEEYLLPQSGTPLVLCLDDVDLLFSYSNIYRDVFSLLRSWYEKAQRRPLWGQLRMAIVYSTDAYLPLHIEQSPFNVGLPLTLPDFNLEQTRTLAQYCGMPSSSPQIGMDGFLNLLNLVGGHPCLLEMAFKYLQQHPEITVDQLIEEAPTNAGIYSAHLRQHFMTLQHSPDLAIAFDQLVNDTQPPPLDPIETYHLQSMGLVSLQGNDVKPRCELYCLYFSQHRVIIRNRQILSLTP